MSIPTTGEYNIVINMPSETGEGNAPAPSPASPQQENAPVQNPSGGRGNNNFSALAVTNAAISVGRQAVNTAISNIGLATGDSYKQAQIQRTMSIGAQALAFGGALVSGNYIAAAVMVAGQAISFASESYQLNKQREIENYSAEQYARKIGYTNARK